MFYNESAWENYGASRAYQHNNPLETSEKFFMNGQEIKDLVIPSGVTKITPFAFYGAKMLTSVSMPNSVKDIWPYAFAGCTAVKSAIIPDNVEIIDYAFNACSSLKELTIGRGVKKMRGVLGRPNENSSYYLESLERINISDLKAWCKITYGGYEIGSGINPRSPFARIPPSKSPMKASSSTTLPRLFLNGQEVKDLVVPIGIFDGVESVDNEYTFGMVFCSNASLTSVTIPKDVVPGGISCSIPSYSDRGVNNCPNLKSIKNETSLKILEIKDCDKLETLSLGKYTKRCKVYGCKNLADVYCAAIPNVASFGAECQVGYATLHVPEILIDKYRTFSFGNFITWKDFGSIVALKPGDPGYVANPDNTAITFADAAFGAAAIAAFDFDGDGKLSKYEASLVTDFGEAFNGNASIKSLDDLKYFTSMKTLGGFSGCTGLTAVTIPNFIIAIEGAFSDCRNLNYVTIPNSVTDIGRYAFSGCSSLTSVTIPNSVMSIGDCAFKWCGLDSISLPNSIISIGEDAFLCNMTSISIPSSVKFIGNGAFEYNSLSSVHITDLTEWCGITFSSSGILGYPSNPLSRQAHLFINGKEITNLIIPNTVTSINNGAFYGCGGLTSITIPNTVTSIGDMCFYNCRDVEKVYSKIEEPFAIDDNVFYYYGNSNNFTSATLYVPRGTKAKYQATEGWKNFQTIIETDFNDEPQGDVNGDNVVDVADIASVISVMASSTAPQSSTAPNPADVNGDGVVDVADIATIISEMAAQARMQEETTE